MTQSSITEALQLVYVGGTLLLLVAASFIRLPTVQAQDLSPLAKLETLGLDTVEVGHVTAYFAPADRARAEEMAVLISKLQILKRL